MNDEEKFSLTKYVKNAGRVIKDTCPQSLQDLRDTPTLLAGFGLGTGALMGIIADTASTNNTIPFKREDTDAARDAGNAAGLDLATQLGVTGLTNEALDKIIAARMTATSQTLEKQHDDYFTAFQAKSDTGTAAAKGAAIGGSSVLLAALLLASLPGSWVKRENTSQKPAQGQGGGVGR